MQLYDPAYSQGWNAAADGALPSDNPYPNLKPAELADGKLVFTSARDMLFNASGSGFSLFIPGQTKNNLWLSGLADYYASPFWCEALRRYRAFRTHNNIGIFSNNDSQGKHNSFGWTQVYADGSKAHISETLIMIFGKDGARFIQFDRT